ncbi:MAG TPA: adenylate/guanylate cyclase domain-containing protein, partial [Polyangiaceae bacterium]|nr:adenylate/guanylate cyclase domain-containing protein [Polyangiaceae bacterium]
MRTVRFKLVALVLACVLPAIVGAVLRSRAAERDMLDQVERRVNATNHRFGEELEEDQANAGLALAMAENSTKFRQALEAHDAAGAAPLVTRLAEAYRGRIILASDSKGFVLARGNAEHGPASLDATSSPAFADLLAGKPLTGMIEVRFTDVPGNAYAMVSAVPVRVNDAQVGAIALLTPVTAEYLERLEPRLNADLSIRVNEKVVAACADHPAPDLESHAPTAVLKEVGAKIFALKTFRPDSLQRPDMEVEITASREITELRDQTRHALYVQLGGLGVVLALVLALALRFASRMGGAVRSIADAAEKVKGGEYVHAPVIRTGDELESLALSFNGMVEGLKERDRLRETFGRYVTRQVADHLMKGNNMSLGGQLVPVTVLFSDIRAFTTISETMEPRALLDFLNEYFSGMVESVMLHNGVVDKFIGDAIMAVF